MARVLHTAQALVDVVIEVPHLPSRGNNSNASAPPTSYPGGAVNIVVAAARSGAKAAHGGALGEGPQGDLIRATLAAEGVEFTAPMVPGKDSGTCYVFVEPSAERTFVTCFGAERDITAESLGTLSPNPGDLVCVSGYSLFEPTRDPLLAFLGALEPSIDIVLDPGAPFASFPESLRTQVLSRTTVWTSNADEARALAATVEPRGDTLSPAQANPAIAPLLPADATVIVRDGADGCYVSTARGPVTHVPGFPQTPLDTNGAGDSHTGILMGERSLGTPWLDAARRANAGAAIKVQHKGPMSTPSRAEIDAFLLDEAPTHR